VRALLIVPRLPGTGFTGDRLRAEVHLAALAGAGYDVTLAGGQPWGDLPPEIPGASGIVPVALSPWRLPVALFRAVTSGAPLQSALFAGPWKRALATAGIGFDLVVVLLPSRVLPHVVHALPEAPLVCDYVDALGAAARQASECDPAIWRRLYWKLEAPRLERSEREAGEHARVLLVTTTFDAGSLPKGTVAVANGVVIGPPPSLVPRGPVVAFTGRLRYRPNELAVKSLATEIWPHVRAAVPEARLLLGGADAPHGVLSWHGRNGIEVTSPVGDMAAFLRQARAVAVPVVLGTGTPNKLFEAFEAGCAIVASEEAAARAASDGELPPVRIARSAEELAAALADYLLKPPVATADGLRGRAWVEAHADRRQCVSGLAERYRRAREAAA
jgi:glycosyltransferase involved in cell wall biosynthesis